MKSNYQIELTTRVLDSNFEIDSENKLVRVSEGIRELREDLRSIIIDEAIRAGEHYEYLKSLPPEERKQLKIRQEARERARQVSLNRYGKLRDKAFQKLRE